MARIRLSVHNKLPIGFLSGALLLTGVAAPGLVVIDQYWGGNQSCEY